MNGEMKWLLMAMLVSLSRSRVCPNNGNCSSQLVNYNICEFRCPSDKNPKFIVQSNINKPEYFIECHNAATWSEFGYQSTIPFDSELPYTFKIERCPLPDGSFIHIMRKLGFTSAYALKFTWRMNSSTTLTRRHLSMLSEIQILNLSFNGLTELPSDLFRDLRMLHVLDLSSNKIAKLPYNIFYGLSVLWKIDLSYNAMKFVDWRLFDNIWALEWLSLRGNLLTNLDYRIFHDANDFYFMDLAENLLETLPLYKSEDSSSWSLSLSLDISGNNFSTLPEDLLYRHKLVKLTLGHNRGSLTTLPIKFLNNLSQLVEVILIRNKFTSLPENIFWGSFSVESIDLHGNALSTLPKNIFRDSTSLTFLDLSDNRLDYVPDGLFGALSKLRRLNLARNSIVSLSENIFENLYFLLELNLESNNIIDFHWATFGKLQNIQLIRLSHNSFEHGLFDSFELKHFFGPTIQRVFLDHNNLNGTYCTGSTTLQLVDLTYNQISNLEVRSPSSESHGVKYDLRHNKLRNIDVSEEISSKMIILVDDNPLDCGCQLYDSLKYMHEIRKPQSGKNLEIILGNASCSVPFRMKGTPVASLRLESFTCDLDDNIDFVRCAKGCDCWWRPHDKTRIVDCFSRNLAKMPNEIIELNHVDDHGFLPYYRWRDVLYQHAIRWSLWKYTPVELDLANNALTEIPPLKESAYKYVEKLILSHNNILKLSFDVLPPRVETIRLDHNDLEKFDRVALNAVINSATLKKLNIEGNPLSCASDTRSALDSMENKLGSNLLYSMKECLDYRNPPHIKKTSTLYISYTIF